LELQRPDDHIYLSILREELQLFVVERQRRIDARMLLFNL
jgi:hypothetical protein